MAKKPRGSHWAYKEWASSINYYKQQNIIRIIHTKNQWQSYRALPCRYSNNFYNFSLQDPETEIASCKWWLVI